MAWLNHWELIAFAVIVFGGMLVFGLGDLGRFSLTRAWAISGVCFDDSIRRRVLWITPLAIVGIILITQFQKSIDEEDALRQSLKICLFGAGMVVILVSIILAGTNLPKEIESRVIYTVVTKPVTRLELIVGKVIGFSRVSFVVLLIMGLFTWGYLRLREYQKNGDLVARLQQGDIGDTERARLTHYLQSGMLTARSLRVPNGLQIFGRAPEPNSPIRVICDDGTEEFAAGFNADRNLVFGPMPDSQNPEEWAHQGIGQVGMILRVEMNTKRTGPATDQPESGATAAGIMGPQLPTSRNTPRHIDPPLIQLELLNGDLYSLASGTEFVGVSSEADLQRAIGDYVKAGHIAPGDTASDVRLSEPTTQADGSTTQVVYAWVPPPIAQRFFNLDQFFLRVSGASGSVDYLIGPDPVQAFLPPSTVVPHATGPDGKVLPLVFRGRMGIRGDEEIQGTDSGPAGVAVYGFRNVPPPTPSDGQIQFELNLQVDRISSETVEGHEDATKVDVVVTDLTSGKTTAQSIQLENNLTTFISVPAGAITGPDFDVMLSCASPGQTIGVFPQRSLQLVMSRQSFEINLIKSLSILWMMSILVLTLAIFCSTFLSWPIAIILTVVLLLGRWGFTQMADVTGPGLGRQIVNDFKVNDAPVARVVSTSVDALSNAMATVSKFMPDTGSFDAISDIEQGVTISSHELLAALKMMGGFGLPAVVVGYLILGRKEVAP